MSKISDPTGKFNGKELEYISEFLDTITEKKTKPFVQRFEEEVTRKIGTKYAVACNSGTSALHMAMFAANIQPGDEVIVPSLTVVMDAYAAIHMGATPVFADIDKKTYGIDPEDVKRKITKKTKAIITVSLQGLSVDIDPIMSLAKQNNIIVIDDSAQNIMGKYKGRLAGNLADINTFSFENKKHITAGSEGGMLLTNCSHFAERARKFGGIGYKHMTALAGRTSLAMSDVQDPDYERFDTIGLNYRMSEACAAIGLAQFERIDHIVSRRVQVAQLFNNAVKDCDWIIPQFVPDQYEHSHYTVSFEYNGDKIKGISWKEFYNMYTEMGGDGFYSACIVPYLEPVFQNNPSYNKILTKGLCPVAEEMQKKIMQFKTNYRSIDDAEHKANILKNLVDKIEHKK